MMINEDALHKLNALTHDPVWKDIIVARLRFMLEGADKDFHRATKDTFDLKKSRYETLLEIYNMFNEPRQLVDDGFKNLVPGVQAPYAKSTQAKGGS